MNDAYRDAAPASATLTSATHASVQHIVQAWALEELAYWRLNRLDPARTAPGFAALNTTSRNIFVYAFSAGSVELLEKPDGVVGIPNDKKRAFAYLDFFRAVCQSLPDLGPFHLALCTGDKVTQRVDLPLFAFQKRRGEPSLLLPDIDFLNTDFYAAAKYDDRHTYGGKQAKAIFVGSTSGGRVTPEVARACSTPRLRAARHFNGNARVDFLLPQIVQTSSEEATEILRQEAFCQVGYIAWQEQLLRRFVISMDGNGATCSRVVIALKSNSVLLKYDSDDLLYYFRHMQPWLHYVPASRDSDIDAILDMEQAQPDLFESIAEHGRDFAETYLSRDAVFAYTAEVFKIYAACFQAGAPAVTALPPPPSAPPSQAPRFNVVLVAHMQGRGDVTANDDGWIGDAKEGRVIEGFSFSLGRPRLNRQFTYRGLAADGTASAPLPGATYCGTRGQAMPLHGFVIDENAEAALLPPIVYEGIFRDGFASGPLTPGSVCKSPQGAALVAMRIGVGAG